MKTKTFIILLAFGIALTSCKSASKLAMEGKYDKAFDKALSSLKKQPNNTESLEILKLSFNNANERNLNRISQLQARNSADSWIEIADLYKNIQDRQDKMGQILPFLPSSAQYSINLSDFSYQLANAQGKAADYNFERGMALLKMNSKARAREAVNYFRNAQKYDPSDPEIRRMIEEATFLGANHVLYIVNNYTPQILPEDFMIRMSQIPTKSYLSSSWVKYYIFPESGFNYDYIIELNIESINAVPERINTRTSSYSRVIDDGWEYEYDKNGNVKKDASGNDIKRPKTIQVKGEVVITEQSKSVFINGRVNYIHSRTNSIVRSIPISLEQPFLHEYVTFRGDRRAIDNQTLSRLPKSELPVPFPSVTDFIFMSQERMAAMVTQILKDNDKLIRNSE